MTPDELLTTTRSVRRRLDLERPVPRELIVDCIQVATQAPTGGNRQQWHWLVVTDPEKRRFIGERYRESWYAYASEGRPTYEPGDPRRKQLKGVVTSARYLADHMGEVPALVIAGIEGRVDGRDNLDIAGLYGSIVPAVWSFMLAARLRGLGVPACGFGVAFWETVARLGQEAQREVRPRVAALRGLGEPGDCSAEIPLRPEPIAVHAGQVEL